MQPCEKRYWDVSMPNTVRLSLASCGLCNCLQSNMHTALGTDLLVVGVCWATAGQKLLEEPILLLRLYLAIPMRSVPLGSVVPEMFQADRSR